MLALGFGLYFLLHHWTMDNREEIHKELGPVVEHIFLWECISCKPHSQLVNSVLS